MTNDKAAELLAAVKAVESGERSATSFFTESAPAPPRTPVPEASPTPPASSTGGAAPAAPEPVAGPVAVPPSLRELLARGGAPEALLTPAAAHLGEGAAETLAADPWQLLALPQVTPEQADAFARALLGEQAGPADPRRGTALVAWLLERAALRGHSAMSPEELSSGLAGYAVPEPDEAVREAVESGAVLAFEDALDAGPAPRTGGAAAQAPGEEEAEQQPVRLLLGLDRYALAEESLADGLARLLATVRETDGPQGTQSADSPEPAASAEGANAPPVAVDWEAAAGAAPSPSAAELVRAVAHSGVVVHTGGEAARREPATLAALASAQGLRVCLAAHTAHGRATLAELVSETGGFAAAQGPEGSGAGSAEGVGASSGGPHLATVAGLLAGGEGPARDAEGRWPLDLLVVCDAQQMDTETAAVLVESLVEGARLVLSGDPGTLGAPGPGRVLGDVLATKVGPHVASRTPDPGPLGELVSGVGIGELSEVEAPGREVVSVPVGDPGEAVHRTVQLVADSIPRAIGVPTEQTQVLTLGHGGAVGTRALNTALKQQLNPGPGQFDGFDVGDRVAHSPAPGHTAVGTVAEAVAEGLRIETDEGTVTVARERLGGTLRHGWALTAHQAAGLRWPAVVVVVPGDAGGSLTREWVYTACGRAAQHLSLVNGLVQELPRIVAERTAPERTTRLATLLTRSARQAAADAAAAAGG